jgi:hypothetical protein
VTGSPLAIHQRNKVVFLSQNKKYGLEKIGSLGDVALKQHKHVLASTLTPRSSLRLALAASTLPKPETRIQQTANGFYSERRQKRRPYQCRSNSRDRQYRGDHSHATIQVIA